MVVAARTGVSGLQPATAERLPENARSYGRRPAERNARGWRQGRAAPVCMQTRRFPDASVGGNGAAGAGVKTRVIYPDIRTLATSEGKAITCGPLF